VPGEPAPPPDADVDPDPADALVVIDGNNVMGARPDGWWRDRPAAARRLLARVQCFAGGRPGPVVLVLDVPQPDLPAGDHGGVEVLYPARRGRDAADDRIVELLDERRGGPCDVVVITSDRGLAARAAQRDARVTRARAFLARLADRGC
jgi:hypothetical protein